jgi:pSer/pThr/pTyr-binding forkhead associated (FHA) protein
MARPIRLIERGDSPEQTREVPILQSEFLIGRGADCDLRLRVSSVSRHHCIVRVAGDETVLIDLGSSNGTFVNNHCVRSQIVLHTGDEIRLGTCRFVVDLGDEHSDQLGVPDVNPLTATLKLPEPPTKSS